MDDSLEDFLKKYRHTYIRIKNKKGDLEVAYIENGDYENESVILTVEGVGTITLKYPNCVEHLNFESPDAGYFNHNNNALYLFKTPARQWQRGLCSANHEIYNPFKKLLTDGLYRPQFGRATVNAIFNPNFYSNTALAIEAVGKEKIVSVALSKNLMLSKNPITNDPFCPMIWYKTNPVGFVKQGKHFVVEDELFEQEVSDELRQFEGNKWTF